MTWTNHSKNKESGRINTALEDRLLSYSDSTRAQTLKDLLDLITEVSEALDPC